MINEIIENESGTSEDGIGDGVLDGMSQNITQDNDINTTIDGDGNTVTNSQDNRISQGREAYATKKATGLKDQYVLNLLNR